MLRLRRPLGQDTQMPGDPFNTPDYGGSAYTPDPVSMPADSGYTPNVSPAVSHDVTYADSGSTVNHLPAIPPTTITASASQAAQPNVSVMPPMTQAQCASIGGTIWNNQCCSTAWNQCSPLIGAPGAPNSGTVAAAAASAYLTASRGMYPGTYPNYLQPTYANVSAPPSNMTLYAMLGGAALLILAVSLR